jgi:hypothetical protein
MRMMNLLLMTMNEDRLSYDFHDLDGLEVLLSHLLSYGHVRINLISSPNDI